MDRVDISILENLKKDSRTPFLGIARQLKVSEGTIRKRVKDLVKSKRIKRFTIETSEDVFAIVGIQTETRTETKKIGERIKNYGIESLFEVTGRFDIICMVPSNDREKVNELLERIRSTQGVLHTETFTILKKD